eukprot:g6451.t1
MFCLCGGGGRKDKTRKDFVAAVPGFDQGIAVDHGSTSGNSTPQHGREYSVAAVEGGRQDLVHENAPPPYPEARNGRGVEKRPSSPPKSSECTAAIPSDQKGPMSMLAPPEDSLYSDPYMRDHDAASQRPGWMDQSYSQHKPDLVVAESQAQLDSYPNPSRPGLNNTRSVRPGWMVQSEGVNARSVRPGWIDETESLAAQSVRPSWIDDTESVAGQSVRPGWIDDTRSVSAQSIQPGWTDDTESESAQSVRPGWIDDTGSVAGQSVRPGWLGDTESVAAQSVRPGWMDDTESVAGQSVRPGWIDDTESVAGQSVRPGWMDDTESVAAQSVRPGWIDDTGSVAGQSVRPGWMDDTESVAAQSVRRGWTDDTGSVAAQSIRPGWMDGNGPGVGNTEPNAFDASQTAVDESESFRPGWIHDDARSQRPGWFEGAAAASVKGQPWCVSPKASLEKCPASPETTRGGQSSSEGAERPRSELADSPKNTASDGMTATSNVSRIAHNNGDGVDSEINNDRLLELILDTDEKEAIRRKNNEGLRSTERARRVFLSSPPEGIRKEVDELSKQQAPRQETSEGAKFRIVRSKTMPTAENVSTTPRVPVTEKRPSTPTSSEDLGRKGLRPSPRLRQRPVPDNISDTPPQILSSSPRVTRDPKKRRSSKPSKPKVSTESKTPTDDTRPRRSSESSSTSSADSKCNNTGRPQRRDRQPTGAGTPDVVDVVSVRPSVEQHQAPATGNTAAPAPARSPDSKTRGKMWNSKNPPAAASQRDAAGKPSMMRRGHEVTPGAGAALAAPLSKPILPPGRRGRQQPLKLGTPRERRTTRNHSRPRLRIPSALTPLEEEDPTSPLTVKPFRGTSDVPPFAVKREDKNYAGPGSAKDLAERLLLEKLGKAGDHGAPTSSAHRPEEPALQNDSARGKLVEMPKDGTNSTEDKDDAGKMWLEQRKRLAASTVREDLVRRRGSQRLSRSSSWGDGSCSSFHGQQAMFSPGRFNPTSGALSLGSVDDSWCDGSARSVMTGGTRNSSSASLGGRGPSDRKLPPPQLSESEKQTVELLKIKRSQVHFGYHPVRGSQRVYKIELNGEMRAAKVINTLGMNKEEMAEVLETFDAELLDLSRINSPHIVKVYGASVSPAEIIVVSEFVEGGVLQSLFNNDRRRKHLTERVRLGIAKDTAMGMKTLYAYGMQHRHLSSKSILLTSDFRAKILGVGLTMTTELISFFNHEERAEEELESELPWASREVLAGAGFSEKSDVYSFGIVLWELMQKEPCLPYAGLLPSQVVGAKYNGEGPPVPKDCPPTIGRLMESCWSKKPAERPSFVNICEILDATLQQHL